MGDAGSVLPLDPAPLVLVVDDEPAARATIAQLVRTLGFQARACPSGTAALTFLREHVSPVRLVLTDVVMPRMDGGELAERIQDLDPRVPVALMATPGDPKASDLLAGYGDPPFLAKPVVLETLAELLMTVIGPPGRTPGPRSMGRVAARRRSSGHTRIP